MKKSEAIQGVMDLLAEPESWTKWAMARPVKDGGALGITDYSSSMHAGTCNEAETRAQSWCLSGALSRVTNWMETGYSCSEDYEPAWRLLDKLARERGFRTAVELNNDAETTHEDLMLFLKEALVSAQIEESQAAIAANLRDSD